MTLANPGPTAQLPRLWGLGKVEAAQCREGWAGGEWGGGREWPAGSWVGGRGGEGEAGRCQGSWCRLACRRQSLTAERARALFRELTGVQGVGGREEEAVSAGSARRRRSPLPGTTQCVAATGGPVLTPCPVRGAGGQGDWGPEPARHGAGLPSRWCWSAGWEGGCREDVALGPATWPWEAGWAARAEEGLTTLRAPPTGYQIAYRLARSSPHTFTTVEVGATVRQFTATELAPESAYTFRLSAKTRQGWGEPLEATVITTEKRGETWGPGQSRRREGDPLEPWRHVASRSGLRGRRGGVSGH